MDLLITALSLFFPENCLLCKNASGPLCSSCATKLTPSPLPKEPNQFAGFLYQNPDIRTLIHSLRKRKNKKLTEILVQKSYLIFLEEFHDYSTRVGIHKPLLLPISSTNKRNRGFSSAELTTKTYKKILPNSILLNTKKLHLVKERHIIVIDDVLQEEKIQEMKRMLLPYKPLSITYIGIAY
jgi:predicted amidophosphoribosyltransferase